MSSNLSGPILLFSRYFPELIKKIPSLRLFIGKHEKKEVTFNKKIQCPLLVLWAAAGAMGKIYDVLNIWKDEGVNVTGKGLPGNHSLQESAPKETLAELQRFLRG